MYVVQLDSVEMVFAALCFFPLEREESRRCSVRVCDCMFSRPVSQYQSQFSSESKIFRGAL